jgi:UPF0716 protein FxsA
VLAVLGLVFVVYPIVEVTVAIQVAHHIGVANTIGLLFLVSIAGAWLAKRQGFSIIRRMRNDVDRGLVPTNALIDTALVFAGGVLLFVPGFVTGAIGLLLVLPPIRVGARNALKRRFQHRVRRFGPDPRSGPGVIDV